MCRLRRALWFAETVSESAVPPLCGAAITNAEQSANLLPGQSALAPVAYEVILVNVESAARQGNQKQPRARVAGIHRPLMLAGVHRPLGLDRPGDGNDASLGMEAPGTVPMLLADLTEPLHQSLACIPGVTVRIGDHVCQHNADISTALRRERTASRHRNAKHAASGRNGSISSPRPADDGTDAPQQVRHGRGPDRLHHRSPRGRRSHLKTPLAALQGLPPRAQAGPQNPGGV